MIVAANEEEQYPKVISFLKDAKELYKNNMNNRELKTHGQPSHVAHMLGSEFMHDDRCVL